MTGLCVLRASTAVFMAVYLLRAIYSSGLFIRSRLFMAQGCLWLRAVYGLGLFIRLRLSMAQGYLYAQGCLHAQGC
jgi:hypothetical protein